MNLYIKILLMLIANLILFSSSMANWTGNQEVVSGLWGKEPGQFHFYSGDSFDYFPKDFGVDFQGNIIINDGSNNRIQIYSSDGVLKKVIAPPVEYNITKSWPYDIYVHPDGYFVAGYEGPQNYFFDSSGNFYKKVDVFGLAIPTQKGFIFEVSSKEYSLYSTTGQPLQTYTERPLELGWIESQRISSSKKRITIMYPDKTWGILGNSVCRGYVRDANGNLYCFDETDIIRFNTCGRSIGSLHMPEERYQISILPPDWPENVEPPKRQIAEEYGSPVLAPNGDVYTWKRTPDKYSIIKWTWQDDPNALANLPDSPTDLKIEPSPTSLTLSWKASLQDPGCVAGYEVARSVTAGEGYTTIGTVDKGILKYEDTTAEPGKTYYYKVRSMGGEGYSGYSNEASGARTP